MPLYIDEEIANWVDVCWSEHRSDSALKIWQRVKDDWGEDGPSKRWVSSRVKGLKSRVRELDPEPIARPWGKYWPTDADSVEVLLTLHHEADLLSSSNGVRDFRGVTARMAVWACKIRNFFDCSNALDRLMLLQFSIWFAGQDRWGVEQYGQEADPYTSTHTATSGLMAWHKRDSNLKQTGENRWGHVFRIWDMWAEDEATVRQIVCDYLSGHIFPLTSSRRMFPIFDQFQLEEMDVTPGREEVVQPEATYEPIDNLDDLDSDWMDIP